MPAANHEQSPPIRVSHSPSGPEGLSVFRIIMVLSSLAPLFVLWGLRGIDIIPDAWFIPACSTLVVLPTVLVQRRISRAIAKSDRRSLTVGTSEDSRKHLLVYLFATLLPFYRTAIDSHRDLAAMVVALLLVLFLFWHLKLHYINIVLAFKKYRAFTIHPPVDGSPFTGTSSLVLLTMRDHLPSGTDVVAYRVTDSVYLELPDGS